MNIWKYSHTRRIAIILLGVIIISSYVALSHKEVLWNNAMGALFGLIIGLLLYEFSLAFDEISKEKTVKENTKYIYELYKIELETNINHIKNIIEKGWIPFYRLQTSTRDNLWGEIADYSRDLNLMRRINALYNEFALINNKIDIMNTVRLQLTVRPYKEMSGVSIPDDIATLRAELDSQLKGCVGLGAGAIKIAEECLSAISEHMKKEGDPNNMSQYRKFLDSATFKATMISVIASIILGLISFIVNLNISKSADKIAKEALDYTKKEFAVQYTPELRIYIRSWNVYVGSGNKIGRDDNIVEIPLAICNKSYGMAKDIEVVLVYNDGASTNDKAMTQIIPVLKGPDIVNLPSFAPSVLADSVSAYSTKQKTFKMKIFLNWKDASGEVYSSVELFKIDATEAYSDYPSRFVFVSRGYYDLVSSKNEFEQHSAKKIDF